MSRTEDNVFMFLVVVVILAVLGGLGSIAFLAIRSDGRADYCYTKTMSEVPGAVLIMHRPWRSDAPVQIVRDAAEAKAAADAIGCPLGGIGK